MALRLLMPLPADASETLRWVALLCSYCVHAGVWAIVAALLARRHAQPVRANQLWKLAAFGPLLTTALSALFPLGAVWSSTAPFAQLVQAPGALSDLGAPALRGELSAAWSLRGSLESGLLASFLIASALLGLARFGASLRLLSRTLGDRTAVRDARLCARFEQLRQQTKLSQARLTESPHALVPLVFGRAEICVPTGQLAVFTDAEVDAIFAHELAHLERHDGLWFPLLGLLEAVLWLQPLNRWVAARYRLSAELACDDRAVELTRAPIALARALARMSELALSTRRASVLVPAMASSNVQLGRVKRLLARQESGSPAAEVQGFLRRSWPLLCLVALGSASPSIHVELARARTPASGAETPTAPDAYAFSLAMEQLTLEEQRLERELRRSTDASLVSASDPMVLLNLQQALRHARAMREWTEHRFQGEWEAWSKRSTAPEAAASTH